MKYKKTKRWRYKLEEKHYFHLNGIHDFRIEGYVDSRPLGTLTWVAVEKGYAWDGATGPVFQTKSTKIASLEHDVALQAIELGLIDESYLELFDKHYKETAKANRMLKLRAYIHYWAMRYLRPLIWDRLPKRDYDKVYEV